jgi:hypothetical protein
VGGKVDYHRRTQVGRALHELGVQMIPAYSPQARGRSERNFSTWQGQLPQELRLRQIRTLEAANRFSAARLHRRVQPPFSGRATPLCPVGVVIWSGFLAAVRTQREPRQHGELSESTATAGAGGLARHAGGLPGHGASAADGTLSITHGPHLLAHYTAEGTRQSTTKMAARRAVEKTQSGKAQKPTFPLCLEIPHTPRDSHFRTSPDRCWLNLKDRTFHLLQNRTF